MPLRFSTLYRKTKPPVEISLILGWGEGIFARLLPFPFRLSKRKAQGRGCGGNSAFLLPNQNEASPATLQFIAGHHRKILFSLGEKEIRRAQNEKSKEDFSVVGRGGGWFPYWGFCSKNVRTSIKKHRQESHFEKSRLEASAQSASAWYFSAILKAFLKSKTKVRSAMRKFLCDSTEKTKFSEPIFFLSLSAKG